MPKIHWICKSNTVSTVHLPYVLIICDWYFANSIHDTDITCNEHTLYTHSFTTLCLPYICRMFYIIICAWYFMNTIHNTAISCNEHMLWTYNFTIPYLTAHLPYVLTYYLLMVFCEQYTWHWYTVYYYKFPYTSRILPVYYPYIIFYRAWISFCFCAAIPCGW